MNPQKTIDQPEKRDHQSLPKTTLAVGVATFGRPTTLLETLERLRQQARRPDRVLVAYVQQEDIANALERFPEVEFIQSVQGTCAQRNRIVEAAAECHFLLFIDDDFFLDFNYCGIVEMTFTSDRHIVAMTGTLLADGVRHGGLTSFEALNILASSHVRSQTFTVFPVFNVYGCNMAFRMASIIAHKLQFDQKLPLYGWYEDVDFSRQLARHGSIVGVSNAYGVHLGVTLGRTSGVRLGYSQVANPLYLAWKGSITWHDSIQRISQRVMKNLVRSIIPEEHVDRRGRLLGNIIALRSLSSGLPDPAQVLKL